MKQRDAEMIYVGFWTDKGMADQACLELLGRLRNKKIFLFGTAGFGGSEAYYQKILANVRTAIDARTRWSESTCARAGCRRRCGTAM